MDLDVRRALDARDFERFRALATEYELSLPDDLKHADFAAQYRDLPTHFGPPHAAFVAYRGGSAAGCIALTICDDATAIVKKLYVVPAHRNRGVARALLSALLAYARRTGVVRVVLDTARDRMQTAYALYRAFGFRECEPYGDVDYRCATFMELRLA